VSRKIDVFIASDPGSLARLAPEATVEAEYGAIVVEGSIATLAHHGPRAGNPAPCVAAVSPLPAGSIVGISHVDLDTIGGIAALMGRKPEAPGFWDLAAFVDVRGPHRLSESGASDEDIARLHAFWAWSENHRVFPERNGSARDVTREVCEAIDVLERILQDDPALLAAGEAFRLAGEALNAASFRSFEGGVIVRESDSFVNHLYSTPDGEAAEAIVALNTKFSSVTLSFADAPQGVSACTIVQGLWGELAGGHVGIAGSPRGEAMTSEDVRACAIAARAVLRNRGGG